ncbi:hypothetical protein GQF56_07015 [Rhodobacter sphaeroides]|jgi:hypothetical protein|uniref:Uncharacterized protein n=2 Tax=Cereibacter sphaeroides TaxID=1063 RepID=Q3J1Y5_CERS4|nr:hypothetical protein [Cereibacter sphaeroides]ABN76770.1 hypothetical protein Rsph17029_1660 [Cereibacter sphaeroides ATCC 17029]EKX57633.1 hypothetical protein D516_1474 [Rhodobacter sp. AKP1]ABA79199.1 hypothetical protein RSP_6084 [Cereibacter sphaeroides 2.4.1]ACM01199.1 Hypothetical Protein RSKD131_1339 [Cereibacter sphaeroides KD131]AXC61414.1 hypothetical protein DQL45_08565 [Cereibacter sphaeroides 2.4.1]
MSDSLAFSAPYPVLAATAPPEADEIPEPENRLPSGWWLLPSVLCGGAFWVAIGMLIF